MSADAEMLNFIYQNSQMGVETLNQLIPMIDNEAFKKRIEAQLKEYEQIHEEEMLIQGSNMGIIDAVKRINQYEKEAEKEVTALMKRLLKFEENNVERLKEAL